MNDAIKIVETSDFLSFFWTSMSHQMTASSYVTQSVDVCTSRNALLWNCIFLGFVNLAFSRAAKVILLRHRFAGHTCNATIRFAWNSCFYAASIVCLSAYFFVYLAATVRRDSGPLFPKYESPLVIPTSNCAMFGSMTNLQLAFYITAALVALNEQDYADGIVKLLFALVLSSLNAYGLDNLSVMLNVWVSMFSLLSELLQLVALHTEKSNVGLLRMLLALRLVFWAYACLHLLPFDFLIPMLYASKFRMWLNVCLWVWYGANVWYSPLLYYCYHKFYHDDEACSGNMCVARCVLVKNTPDFQHQIKLQQTYYTIQLSRKRQEQHGASDNAARAYQTVKCVMALQRKLKRIRANKDKPQRTIPPMMGPLV